MTKTAEFCLDLAGMLPRGPQTGMFCWTWARMLLLDPKLECLAGPSQDVALRTHRMFCWTWAGMLPLDPKLGFAGPSQDVASMTQN